MNYEEVGSELECASAAECMAFARKHGTSTDPLVRDLATFALFSATAKCERLAGRIQVAQLAEMQAESAYVRLQGAGVSW